MSYECVCDSISAIDCWNRRKYLAGVRYPDNAGLDLEDLFLFETKRRVMKDRTLGRCTLVRLHRALTTSLPTNH